MIPDYIESQGAKTAHPTEPAPAPEVNLHGASIWFRFPPTMTIAAAAVALPAVVGFALVLGLAVFVFDGETASLLLLDGDEDLLAARIARLARVIETMGGIEIRSEIGGDVTNRIRSKIEGA